MSLTIGDMIVKEVCELPDEQRLEDAVEEVTSQVDGVIAGNEYVLGTDEVDRMFASLPSELVLIRKNKITGVYRHVRVYLCINRTRSLSNVSYQSGHKEEIIKGLGSVFLLRSNPSLCEAIREMYDMIRKLDIHGDELIIDERE